MEVKEATVWTEWCIKELWLRVNKIFKEIGLRKLDRDEAVYYMIGEK